MLPSHVSLKDLTMIRDLGNVRLTQLICAINDQGWSLAKRTLHSMPTSTSVTSPVSMSKPRNQENLF
jgi:hypothetical protein